MPKLSNAEQEEFLKTPGILMRIACLRSDGSPLITPIWFIHQSNFIYFTPRAQSEWLDCLRRDPRVGLCIDEQDLPYRKLIVEGAAELVHDLGEDDDWRDLYRQMAGRYVPEDAAEAYVQNTIDQSPSIVARTDHSQQLEELANAARRRTSKRHLAPKILCCRHKIL